jgi:hypothetical protein
MNVWRLWEVWKLLSSRAPISFSKTSLLGIRLETRLDMHSGCIFGVTVKCNNRSDTKKGIWRESSIKKEKWRGKDTPKDILVEYLILRCSFELTTESEDFGQAGLTPRISCCMAALSRNITVALHSKTNKDAKSRHSISLFHRAFQFISAQQARPYNIYKKTKLKLL